ncbi:uncharacterized protein LOC143581231 [Bidens hawaiensis]|uniref:uncharacterized protein LOC143581231 n=1 Tax=Bidens hawaiensis TaxID=980011 RepID=UPI00404A765A
MVFAIIQALTDMMFGESEKEMQKRYLRMEANKLRKAFESALTSVEKKEREIEALEKLLLDSHTQQDIKIEELKGILQRIPEGVKKREIEVALEEVLESKRDARQKLEMIIEELKGKLQEKRERVKEWEDEMEAKIKALEIKFMLGGD